VYVHGVYTVDDLLVLKRMRPKEIDRLFGEQYATWLGQSPRFVTNTHHLRAGSLSAVFKPLFTVEEINTIRETNEKKKWEQAFVVPIDSRETVSNAEDHLKKYCEDSAEINAYTAEDHIECLVKTGSWRKHLKKYLRPLDGLTLSPESDETVTEVTLSGTPAAEDPFAACTELADAFMDGVKTDYNTTPEEFFDFQRAMLCSTAMRYKRVGGSVIQSDAHKKTPEFAGPLVDVESTPMIAYLPDVLRKRPFPCPQRSMDVITHYGVSNIISRTWPGIPDLKTFLSQA